MAEASPDSQLESYFTRLDVQLKKSQFKKALKLVDESEPPHHLTLLNYMCLHRKHYISVHQE